MKNLRNWLIAFSIIMALAVIYLSWSNASANKPVVINQTAVAPLPTLNPEIMMQGEVLYAQHCASCHGVDLKGSPTWKELSPDGSLPPPPHDSTGHTWHHTDELLISIILNGGDTASNSKMPAFKNALTEEDAISILEFIKSSWGREEREFQWWITVRPE